MQEPRLTSNIVGCHTWVFTVLQSNVKFYCVIFELVAMIVRKRIKLTLSLVDREFTGLCTPETCQSELGKQFRKGKHVLHMSHIFTNFITILVPLICKLS